MTTVTQNTSANTTWYVGELNRSITIDGRQVSDNWPAYVIAEIGHNHARQLDRAKAMVVSARQAGASAVKFQTRHPHEVYSPAEFNRTSTNPNWLDPVYGKHREKLEFSHEEWRELFAFCRAEKITAFSTPFDFKSADLLASFGVPAFKIASGDATNIPLIEYVADFGKPMLVSTGGCTIEDVDRIYNALSVKEVPFAILQCACYYAAPGEPYPDEVMNLNVITTYRERYPNTVIGLSTHHRSWLPSLAAFAMGARIFEHHYTNDRAWVGTDNHFSLLPDDMIQFTAALDMVGDCLGYYSKGRHPKEEKPTLERRKKIVAAEDIPAGTLIQRRQLAFKCPGDGLEPYRWPEVVGALSAGISKDEDVTFAKAIRKQDIRF